MLATVLVMAVAVIFEPVRIGLAVLMLNRPRPVLQLLAFLCRVRRADPAQMTVYQFWREVAKLDGFLARKRDGEPGWQTLWRGWTYLSSRFEGYLLGLRCG